MDAVYRALDGSSTRVVLSETARRRKDGDAQKRARRKGYAAGLTCAVLDAWWREATDTGSGGRGTQGQLPGDATMSPEQAKAFFSRTGLPNDALASVWELAKSGRRGDPAGLTKTEFECAACLVSLGIHENLQSLKRANITSSQLSTHQKKRLRYAIAGLFWKFEAFDVKPEGGVGGGAGANGQRRSAEEPSNQSSKRIEEVPKTNGTEHMRPLTQPITLNVPVRAKQTTEEFDSDGGEGGWATFVGSTTRTDEKTDEKRKSSQPLPDLFSGLGLGAALGGEVTNCSLKAEPPGVVGGHVGQQQIMSNATLSIPVRTDPSLDISFDLLNLASPTRNTESTSHAGKEYEKNKTIDSFEFDVLKAFDDVDFGGDTDTFEPPNMDPFITEDVYASDSASESDTAASSDATDNVHTLHKKENERKENESVASVSFDEFHETDKQSQPITQVNPEMEEWSTALSAWPWLAETQHNIDSEKVKEGERDDEQGWAAF